jgi:hypothetical protein
VPHFKADMHPLLVKNSIFQVGFGAWLGVFNDSGVLVGAGEVGIDDWHNSFVIDDGVTVAIGDIEIQVHYQIDSIMAWCCIWKSNV